jgi:hypothetical protein
MIGDGIESGIAEHDSVVNGSRIVSSRRSRFDISSSNAVSLINGTIGD